MKEMTARDLVRTLEPGEAPLPAWSRVKMRAAFEDQVAIRRAPFRRLLWIETAIHAGVGLAITALVLWVTFAS